MPQRIASLTPLQDVLARIDALVEPVAPQRIDDLTSALGRIVAEDVIAGPPLPPTAIALRDGWALPSHLTTDAGPYAPASVPAAIRIEVGEMLPADADSVAPLDAVIARNGETQVLAQVTPAEGVLPAGGDAPAGIALIRAGERLDASRVALLAALDIKQANARVPRLRLARAHTGPDRVLDSVRACISDAIGQAGAVVTTAGAYDGLEHALKQRDFDALVVVGGTGCGRQDKAVETLVCVGSVHVHGIGLIPAETAAFGAIGPRPVLLLPGRLDAALAAWHMLGRAMLRRLTGNTEPPCLRTAKLTRKVSSTLGLAELVPVRCEGSLAAPLGSGYLPISVLCRANGWILVPPESEGQPEHSEVAVRSWP
ncbi:MAG TPA: molybdopterin-binding protein [Xanthobacteraceae bacterium]|jgi:molybdopterin biosynthesis enzyme